MRGILSVLHSDTEVASALSDSSKIIAPASSYPFLIAMKAQEKPLLIVTSSSRGAEDLSEYLKSLHPLVYEFPAWETLPHERLSHAVTLWRADSQLCIRSTKSRATPLLSHPCAQ